MKENERITSGIYFEGMTSIRSVLRGFDIGINNRRKVLVVGNVFCEYYESNRNVSNSNSCNIFPVKLGEAAQSLKEGEFRKCNEGLERYTVSNQSLEGSKVNYSQRVVAGSRQEYQ